MASLVDLRHRWELAIRRVLPGRLSAALHRPLVVGLTACWSSALLLHSHTNHTFTLCYVTTCWSWINQHSDCSDWLVLGPHLPPLRKNSPKSLHKLPRYTANCHCKLILYVKFSNGKYSELWPHKNTVECHTNLTNYFLDYT